MLDLFILLIYAGIGIISGFFSGLLGIGGGVIVAPLLIFVFTSFLNFDAGISTHMAIATSMSVITINALMSAATHSYHKNINWNIVPFLAISVIIGAFWGTSLAIILPGVTLQIILILFLLYNAYVMLLQSPKKNIPSQKIVLNKLELSSVGSGVGVVASLLGIGGGVIFVPYLLRRGVPIKNAIGSSAFLNFPLALAGTIGYIVSSPPKGVILPEESWGYIYPTALVSIAVFGVVAAYLGARLSNHSKPQVLRSIFGFLALIIAIRLIVANVIHYA